MSSLPSPQRLFFDVLKERQAAALKEVSEEEEYVEDHDPVPSQERDYEAEIMKLQEELKVVRDDDPERQMKINFLAKGIKQLERKQQHRHKRRGVSDVPVSYQRTRCLAGHVCSEPQCYTSQTNPRIIWDKSKYRRPYYPRTGRSYRTKSK